MRSFVTQQIHNMYLTGIVLYMCTTSVNLYCCPVCFWFQALGQSGCQWWWRAAVRSQWLLSDFWGPVRPDTWAPRWMKDLQKRTWNSRCIEMIFFFQRALSFSTSQTCADAHYEPSHDNDLIGLGQLTDSHHQCGDNGKDVVEKESSLSVRPQKYRWSAWLVPTYCHANRRSHGTHTKYIFE